MSGAEAILVLGIISSIIGIVDGMKQVCEAAVDAEGLPRTFREVSDRLALVGSILESTRQRIDRGDVNEDACKGVISVVRNCKDKTSKLDRIFRQVIPADDASRLNRYYHAVKAYGKGSTVGELMEGVMKDIQLLSFEHGLSTAAQSEREALNNAIAEISALPASVPEYVFQDHNFINNNWGSGSQTNYNNLGDQHINRANGNIYNAQSMSFGKN